MARRKNSGLLLVPFIILSCCTLSTIDASIWKRSAHNVEVNNEFCQLTSSLLYCDYKWNHGTVYLRDQPKCERDCNTVFIEKVHELVLYRSVCHDLTLKHIGKVTVKGEAPKDCLRMNLSIQNVTLDFVGDTVTSVYADESRIEELNLNNQGGQLTVIGSKVGVLSIPDIRGDDASLKIHSTTIRDFKQLKISGSGRFHLQDSVVEDFPPESLVLDASRRNFISSVHFARFEEETPASIVLRNGADLTIEDIKGGIKIASQKCPSSGDSPSPPERGIIQLTTKENNITMKENGEALGHTQANNDKLIVAVVFSVVTNFLLILMTSYLCFIMIKGKIRTKKTSDNFKYVNEPLISKENEHRIEYINKLRNVQKASIIARQSQIPKKRTISYPTILR